MCYRRRRNKTSAVLSRAARLAGAIELDNVSFRYGPLAPVGVRQVSVQIAPGQKVAIVGRSGAGKSTLAKLLLGLYRPSSGRMLYDGLDLAGLDLQSVRQQCGIVTQRSYLFGTTIRSEYHATGPEYPMRTGGGGRPACGHPRRYPGHADGVRHAGHWTAAARCPAGNGSGSRWHGRSCTARPSCCSTKPPVPWTPSPKRRCTGILRPCAARAS